jgi:hypothetical protein
VLRFAPLRVNDRTLWVKYSDFNDFNECARGQEPIRPKRPCLLTECRVFAERELSRMDSRTQFSNGSLLMATGMVVLALMGAVMTTIPLPGKEGRWTKSQERASSELRYSQLRHELQEFLPRADQQVIADTGLSGTFDHPAASENESVAAIDMTSAEATEVTESMESTWQAQTVSATSLPHPPVAPPATTPCDQTALTSEVARLSTQLESLIELKKTAALSQQNEVAAAGPATPPELVAIQEQLARLEATLAGIQLQQHSTQEDRLQPVSEPMPLQEVSISSDEETTTTQQAPEPISDEPPVLFSTETISSETTTSETESGTVPTIAFPEPDLVLPEPDVPDTMDEIPALELEEPGSSTVSEDLRDVQTWRAAPQTDPADLMPAALDDAETRPDATINPDDSSDVAAPLLPDVTMSHEDTSTLNEGSPLAESVEPLTAPLTPSPVIFQQSYRFQAPPVETVVAGAGLNSVPEAAAEHPEHSVSYSDSTAAAGAEGVGSSRDGGMLYQSTDSSQFVTGYDMQSPGQFVWEKPSQSSSNTSAAAALPRRKNTPQQHPVASALGIPRMPKFLLPGSSGRTEGRRTRSATAVPGRGAAMTAQQRTMPGSSISADVGIPYRKSVQPGMASQAIHRASSVIKFAGRSQALQ